MRKAYQTTAEIRESIAKLRRILRERKAKALGHSSNKGRTFTKDGHEWLYGERAHLLRRIEIFRNAGGDVALIEDSTSYSVEELQPATCQGCVEPHLVGWSDGEWHHACTLRKKCDAVKCALFLCPIAHRVITGRDIQWTRKENAERAAA